MKRDIEGTLASLQNDNASLAEVKFAMLSDLSRQEQEMVTVGWTKIPLDKRQRLLATLDDLAENDFHMDFSALFCIALIDDDAEVRRLAVEGLWMDEKPSIIRPLLGLLENDENSGVRASAAFALGRFVLQGEYEEISAERTADIVDTLIRAISNTNEDVLVRARGLEALGFSHDTRVPDIIERVYAAQDPQARRSAICAMGRHASNKWVPIIRREINNEDPAFRFEAVRAAGEMGDKGATGQIVALVKDSDREVREMAVWALGEVGGALARRTLEKLIKDSDPLIRKIAKDALIELRMLEEPDDEGNGLLMFDISPDGTLNQPPEANLLGIEDDDDFDDLLWEDGDDFEDDDDDDEDDSEWDEDDIDLEDDNDFGDDEFDDPLALEDDDDFDDDFNALLEDDLELEEDDLPFDDSDDDWENNR